MEDSYAPSTKRLHAAVDEVVAILPALQTNGSSLSIIRGNGIEPELFCADDDGDLASAIIHYVLAPRLFQVMELLQKLSAIDNRSMWSGSGPPPASSTILSIMHYRAVYTAIELVWCWGLLDLVKPVVDVDGLCSYPSSMLVAKDRVVSLTNAVIKRRSNVPYYDDNVRCMYAVITSEYFSGTMLQRNLPRLLSALMILLKGTSLLTTLTEENDIGMGALLRRLMRDVNKTAVISSLSFATRGPSWMREEGGVIFSTLLLSDRGLDATLMSYLDGIVDGPESTPLQVKVAKLVTSVPARFSLSKERYFINISCQLLDLIKFAINTEDQVLMKVCVLIATRIAHICPAVCDQHLFCPLIDPLLSPGKTSPSSTSIQMTSNVLKSEKEVSGVIRTFHAFVTLCPVLPPLSASLARGGVALTLLRFTVETLAHRSCRNSVLTSQLQEFCHQYFLNCSSYKVVASELMTAIQQPFHYTITLTESGGIEIQKRTSDNFESAMPSLISAQVKPYISSVSVSRDAGTTEELCVGKDLEDVLKMAALLSSQGSETRERSGLSEGLIDVAARAKVVAELLVSFEEVQGTAKSAGSEGVVRGEDKNFRSDPPDGLDDAEEEASGLGGAFFLSVLKSYLSVSEGEEAPGDDATAAKTQSGLVLLVLQSVVPMKILLQNGANVIGLLKLFLEAHAERILLVSSTEPYTPSCSSTSDQSASKARPCSGNAQRAHEFLSGEPSGSVRSLLLVEPSSPQSHHDVGTDDGEPLVIDAFDDSKDTLDSVLAMLAMILELGCANKRSPREEKELRDLLEPLQRISFLGKDAKIAQSASDLSTILLNHFCSLGPPETISPSRSSRSAETPSLRQTLSEAMRDFLSSDSPAIRAMGIRNIVVALRGAEVLRNDDMMKILDCLCDCLSDSESFVFLGALQAISSLADRARRPVFDVLVAAFADWNYTGTDVKGWAIKRLPPRQRSLIGEALMLIVRRAGQAAGPLLPALTAACVHVARKTRATVAAVATIDERIDLQHMKLKKVQSTAIHSSVGDTAESSYGYDKDDSMAVTAALAADELLLRQSAVSLLAQAAGAGGWEAGKYLGVALDVAIGILNLERSSSQATIVMRRSAAFLLRHIVTELKHKLLFIDGHTQDGVRHLRNAYRALRAASSDRDVVVQFHIACGRRAIDDFMLEQLTLKPPP